MGERMTWEIKGTSIVCSADCEQAVERLWSQHDCVLTPASFTGFLPHAHWMLFISLLVILCQGQSKHFKSSWGQSCYLHSHLCCQELQSESTTTITHNLWIENRIEGWIDLLGLLYIGFIIFIYLFCFL